MGEEKSSCLKVGSSIVRANCRVSIGISTLLLR